MMRWLFDRSFVFRRRPSIPVPGGFTLIELLIVITVTVSIFVYGMASFTAFNRREHLKENGLQLKTTLRFAQTKAISSEKPASGCTRFTGMRMHFTSTTYQTEHVCEPEGVIATADCTTGTIRDCVILPPGTAFSSVPADFTFLTKPTTTLTGDLTITLTNGSETYSVIVSPNGNVVVNP